MAREILFKAKRTDNGEWVEGYYCKYGYSGKEKHYIIPDYASDLYVFEIDINTLCQYTGLTDKNGNKIWENDFVGFLDVSQYDNGYSEHYCIGRVDWDEETISFQVTERISCESYEALDGDCIVIGNIFDNPELIKAGGVNE